MEGGKEMSLPVFIPLNVVMSFISVSTPYLQGTVSDVLGLSALGLFMAIARLTMERLISPVSLFLGSDLHGCFLLIWAQSYQRLC
jgi:hypothetical protein